MQAKKFSLFMATILSINIVVGGGFFLSAQKVFHLTGLLSPLPWIICGLFLLPLVLVFAHLSRLYPSAGGIYVYSKKSLGEFWGFFSGWAYFIGTMAGNAMLLYAFGQLIGKLGLTLPFSSSLPPHISQLLLNIFLLCFFTIINMFKITIFERMNIGFTILKIIPMGLVLLAALWLFDFSNVQAAPVKAFGLIDSLPIVLFAYLGIESACAIGHKIKDGKKNTSRAMLISIGIIIAIYALVQFGLLGVVGKSGSNPFFAIVPKLTSNPTIIYWGNLIVKLAILSSFLGGFYGAYYANSWNLYAMAKEKKVSFSPILNKLNKHNTPWTAMIFQGILILLLLLVSLENETTLMIMCGFGVVIAYILSVISYFFTITRKAKQKIITGILALLGSGTLLVLCVNDLAQDGIKYLLPFLALLFYEVVLYRRRIRIKS